MGWTSMQEYSQPLGDAVRKAWLQSKYTKREVANKVGVDVHTILNIENYHGNPKAEVLYPLIHSLSNDPKTIIYPKEINEQPLWQNLQLLFSNCTEEEAAMLFLIYKIIPEVKQT